MCIESWPGGSQTSSNSVASASWLTPGQPASSMRTPPPQRRTRCSRAPKERNFGKRPDRHCSAGDDRCLRHERPTPRANFDVAMPTTAADRRRQVLAQWTRTGRLRQVPIVDAGGRGLNIAVAQGPAVLSWKRTGMDRTMMEMGVARESTRRLSSSPPIRIDHLAPPIAPPLRHCE